VKLWCVRVFAATFREEYSQDEDAESNARCICSLTNSHQVHDQDTTPECCLEAVHGEESSWLQSISEEQENGENIDEKNDDDEKHEHNDRSKIC
jgi:hypothetical protein